MMPSIDLNAAIIRQPLTVPLKTPLLAAIALMDRDLPPGPNLEDDPSCVLVVDHQRVLGILTERDVVRLTIQQQPLGEMTVGQAMSRPIIRLPEAAFVEVAAATRLFKQHHIRHLPLVDSQGLLTGLVTRDSLRQVALAQKLQRAQRQAHLVAEMALRIRQHTQLDTLTTAIVEEVQSFLQADRVVVYQFQPDMSGVIVAESVAPPWIPCLDVQISDTCFQTNLGGAYQQGRVAAVADVYGADLGPCYLELLEQFQVRANLVVPILLPNGDLPHQALPSSAQHPLWGLLIAHQCSGPRVWDELDIDLLQRLSVQLAIALQQADLYQSLQSLNASLEEQVVTRTHTLQTLADRERMQANLATQIRASLDLETILETATREIRAILQCDRVNIWRFGANWQPFVVAESTDSPLSLIGEWVSDTCLQDYAEIYRQGRVRVIADIHTAEMSDCHREMLIRLQVRAKVLVPLLCGDQLWGLLNVTESSQARDWQPEEVELLKALSLQLAIAIQQATTHGQLQGELSKRQQAEALLQGQQAKSRALLTAIPDYLFRVGADGEYREVVTPNRDIDLLPSELNPVGSTLRELLPADIATRHHQYLQQAISTGDLQVYEQQIQVGQRLQHEEVRVIKSGEDEALFMIRDISDRKHLEAQREQAEAALRQSEQTNRAIIETMPDLLIRMDRAGYFGQMSGGSAVKVKYPETSPASTPDLYRVLPPELAEERLYFAHQALETGQLQVYRQRFEVVEGDLRWEEVRIKPLNEQEVLIIIRDVTKSVQLEAERQRTLAILEASEQRFRQLFEVTPQIAVQGCDRDRRIIYWNPVSEQIYGYSSTEALGQKLEDLIIPPEMRAWVVAAIEDWVTDGTAVPASELTLMDKQGNPVEVFSSHAKLNNPVGEPEFYSVDVEIGAVKRAEATLQNLIQGTATTTGRDFFPALVSHIADALDVAYAIVTERVGDQLQTLALWANGALQANFAYLAAPTPCGQALQVGSLYCAHSVQQQFPDCPELVEMGAESYLGIALKDADGEAIGNLCIYHDQPISDPQRAEQILRVFAARATAELERQRATAALEKLNQTLEAKVIERTAALEEREARYRALVNAIPDLLIRMDVEGTYLDVITGDGVELFNPSQVRPGANIYDVLPWDHAQERMGYVHQALQTRAGQSYDYDLIIDGRQISETARIVAINDTEVLVIVQDISERTRLEAERKQAEAALATSQQFIQTVLDTLPLAIFWKDRNSTFLGGNRRSLEAVDVASEQEFIGKTDFDFASTQDNALHYRADDQAVMNSGQAKLAIEEVITTPDGEQIWIETHKAPLLDQNGQVTGLVGAFQDITQRKQAEAELQAKTQALQQSYQYLKEAQAQLVQAEKMSSLGQLVAGVAHEINNPVSFIYGNLGAAQNYIADLQAVLKCYQDAYPNPEPTLQDMLNRADINYVLEDFPKLLKSMENGAVRIRDIVASLRTFSRLDQAKRKAIDIHENIDSTLVILQNRLNGRAGNPEIQVIKNYGDIPPVECYGGPLNQVFMNLLVNAIDAIEARQDQTQAGYSGQVTITTQVSANTVMISIQDNGIGMSPNTQAKIFDPFYTTKPVGIGTGMGLSISYQIVTNDHQGKLTCHSSLGEGTEFRIEL